jgi:hypothetical protein
MILLGSGSYEATAWYTKGGTRSPTQTRTAIVTKEDGSMAVRTNFLYFYKTTGGSYDLTQYWPPLANDAADSNKPEDALLDTQGILEIRNNAIPDYEHEFIARVNIDGAQYPNNTNTAPYMIPGDVRRYILPIGTVYVSFLPTDQTYYGMAIPREITSKAVTKLSYTNNMGKPDFIPEDVTGYGAGLVRITNNTSTGVVSGITVYDRDDLSKFISVGYEDFTPPSPIQYGKLGRAPVYGTANAPLREGISQIIQVTLETSAGDFVVIERIAALKGQVVDIVITQSDLNPGGSDTGGRYGSKVTVRNQTLTSSNIVGMYVYNKQNVDVFTVYYLDIPSPPSGFKSLDVLSTPGFPIAAGETYGARLMVSANGEIGLIDKNFEEGGDLYSKTPETHTRTIILTQDDLLNGMVEDFKPVTGITPTEYTATSYTESDLDGSNPAIIYNASFNLKNVVEVLPFDATTKEITWGSPGGSGSAYVSLNSNTGVFTVNSVAPVGSREVTVGLTIANGKGTATSKQDFTGTITIHLDYNNIRIRTKKVTAITLAPGVTLEAGKTLDLNNLASFNPAGANINGNLIELGDILWSITNAGGTGSSIAGSTLTAGSATGTVTVNAELPAAKNDGTLVSNTVTIQILPANGGYVNITRVYSPDLKWTSFYTKNIVKDGEKTKIVYVGSELVLSRESITIEPSNATWQPKGDRSIQLRIVEGQGAWNKVALLPSSGTVSPCDYDSTFLVKASVPPSNGGDKYVLLGNIPMPHEGDWFKIQVTIPDANRINLASVPFVQADNDTIIVTMREVYHNNITELDSDFHINPTTITVGQTIDLKDLTYLLPGATRINNEPITKDDLVWTIVSGNGTLGNNGSLLTGAAVGSVVVRATLPADKNVGERVVKEATITVTNAPHPSNVTLRLFKIKEDGDSYNDTITRVILVPRTEYYGEAVKSTGYTGRKWADGTKDVTYKSDFETYYLSALSSYQEYILSPGLADGEYKDISVPWPSNGATGYDVFFVEGDNRVRSYTNPWTYNPTLADRYNRNLLFHLDFSYVYDHFLLPMKGKLEATKGDVDALEVIPLYYSSYRNLSAIMKSTSVGSAPVADKTGITH